MSPFLFLFAPTIFLPEDKALKKFAKSTAFATFRKLRSTLVEWMNVVCYENKTETDFQLLLFHKVCQTSFFILLESNVNIGSSKISFLFLFSLSNFFRFKILECLKFYYRIKYERGEKILTFLWGKNKLKFSKRRRGSILAKSKRS